MRRLRRRLLVGLVFGGAVAVGLALAPATVVRGLLDSPWFPVLLVGLYLVRPLLAWPITALSVLVGFRYGLLLGLPIALAGVVVTSLIPYAAARHVRSDQGWVGRATDGSKRFFAGTGDLRGVVAARLAPTPAEPISAAAGVAAVPVSSFVAGTLVGELPWTVAAVLAGRSMRRLGPGGPVVDPWLALAGLAAAALVLAGPAYRFVRRRRAAME